MNITDEYEIWFFGLFYGFLKMSSEQEKKEKKMKKYTAKLFFNISSSIS